MLKKLQTRPLRAMFLLTSMPIGGAETLLLNLVRRLDRSRVEPTIACMKQKDVLGEVLDREIPVFENLILHKYDFAVAGRLKRMFRDQQIDALVTIGAGDKMFWGRLGARLAGVPVILSALHSTGWPDGVGKLNRMLTGITDGFIAVARQHAEYQVNDEKFPQEKVFLIPNGIDTEKFVFSQDSRDQWRDKTGISRTAPVVGIVAALRPEKNHDLFLRAAKRVSVQVPSSKFVIAGDGPERERLERLASELEIKDRVHFLGSVHDICGVLSMLDVFSLTSHNEASPVSIMEALSCGRPVVATDVGSIDESVLEGQNGFLVPAGDQASLADRWVSLLQDASSRTAFGLNGRQHIVANSSLDSMTDGYMQLIENVYQEKCGLPLDDESGFVSWNYQADQAALAR